MVKEGIGFAVRARSIRIVVVRNDRLEWAAERPFAGLETLTSALAELARSAPRPSVIARGGQSHDSRPGFRLVPRRATVVLGPAWVQVRVLEGLPPLGDCARIASLVQLNCDAFFPRRWDGASKVRVEQCGHAMLAAAYDSAALAAVTNGLRHAGFRSVHALPTVRALSVFVRHGDSEWSDAEDLLHLTFSDGSLISIRHSAGEPTANEFDDAAAAALLDKPRRLPLAWRPEPTPVAARRWRVGLLASSFALSLLSLTLAFAADGLRARRDVGANTSTLTLMQAQSSSASRTLADLRRARATMERAARFAAGRGRITLMLADLARSLPESTAVITLRLDSVGGTLTVVGRGVTAVLPAISRLGRIADPHLVGSITRETGPAQLGRAAFRFGLR